MLSRPSLELLFLTPSLFLDVDPIGEALDLVVIPIEDELFRLCLRLRLTPPLPDTSTDLNYHSFLLLERMAGMLD